MPDAPLTDTPKRSERVRSRAVSELESAIERFPVLGTLLVANEREAGAGGVLLAGGLAYRLFFWLVPMGLLSASIASFFTSPNSPALESAARKNGLAGVAADAAQGAIQASDRAHWYLLGFGLVVTIWTGIGVVRAMNIAFALAWGQRPPKLRRPFAASVAFTLIAVFLSAVVTGIGEVVSVTGLGVIGAALTTVLAYGGAAVAITRLFPHGDAPWRALLPGALLISAGTLGLHLFVSIYLAPKLDRSVDTYGILGASTVILLWLYLIARLITMSAFVNSTLWERSQQTS